MALQTAPMPISLPLPFMLLRMMHNALSSAVTLILNGRCFKPNVCPMFCAQCPVEKHQTSAMVLQFLPKLWWMIPRCMKMNLLKFVHKNQLGNTGVLS